jgi:hypothetical protein
MARAEFTHKVDYPDNKGITLTDIADVLLAHERAVRVLPIILERSIEGLKVEKIEIRLVEAESGSLFSEFVVIVWTTFQTNIQARVISTVEALTGAEVPKEYQTLLTLLILLVIFYGAVWVYRRIHAPKDGDGGHIHNQYNSLLHLTAENLHIAPEALDSIIQDATKGPTRKAVGKAAQRFFKPAQRNGAGRVVLEHYGEISKDTVAEIPTEVDIEAQDDPDTVNLPKVKIHLRAYDLDRRDHGWYGLVESEELAGQRMPVYLYPTINPESLKGATEIVADVMIEQRRDDNGEWHPKRIHVLKIYETKQPSKRAKSSRSTGAGSTRKRRSRPGTGSKKRP